MPKQFEVRRDDFSEHRCVDLPARELRDGETRLRIDFFAFTANNLTYAAAGDALGYWQFFPAGSDTDSWGVIPVWGFADVIESRCEDLPEGQRLYGYFPPGDELIIHPSKVKTASLFDASEHRATLPPLYNRYQRVPARAAANREQEVLQALFGPLYNTSFCLFDQIMNKDGYGAEQAIIISASSKTSIGLAYGLADTTRAPDSVGLTSRSNLDFVKGLGIYDSVLAYEQLEELPQKPTLVIDMAGNSELTMKLQARLGEQLRYYISVGLTHWDQNQGGLGSTSDRHEMFFAPTYMLERGGEMPPGEFVRQAQAYVAKAAGASGAWLKLQTFEHIAGLASLYPELCAGRMDPAQGIVCQMARFD
ncbi:MAG: DUF2855 family protein [Congregibacter sp.]